MLKLIGQSICICSQLYKHAYVYSMDSMHAAECDERQNAMCVGLVNKASASKLASAAIHPLCKGQLPFCSKGSVKLQGRQRGASGLGCSFFPSPECHQRDVYDVGRTALAA